MLKVFYYISVVFLSFFSLFFVYAAENVLLIAAVPMVIFLLVFPKYYKKEPTVNFYVKGTDKIVENKIVAEPAETAETEASEDKSEEIAEAPEEDLIDEGYITEVEDDEDFESEPVKEYIHMVQRAYTNHGISLRSERFETKEAAEHFADVFRHNYTSRVNVIEFGSDGYWVYADFIPECQIRSNYRRDSDTYIFANYKYEGRHNLPAPPPEHFIDKYPKVSNVLMFGVITWPILCLILIFEWLRGAARIPGDNVQSKVTAQELANMSGSDFEQYVGRRLKGMGYSNVRVTQTSGDFGADVLATDSNGETVCIQCKHYSQPVGIKAVQEIYSAKQYYGCKKAMVITNATYTKAAIDLANKTGVDLWGNFR